MSGVEGLEEELEEVRETIGELDDKLEEQRNKVEEIEEKVENYERKMISSSRRVSLPADFVCIDKQGCIGEYPSTRIRKGGSKGYDLNELDLNDLLSNLPHGLREVYDSAKKYPEESFTTDELTEYMSENLDENKQHPQKALSERLLTLNALGLLEKEERDTELCYEVVDEENFPASD